MPDSKSPRRLSHPLALLALLVLPAILLWPCLFGERVYVPWDIAQFAPARTMMTDAEYAEVIRNNNTDVTEIPVMFLPELRFIQSELERGELPHWNPYARAGTTVWASSILGIWYPINWIMLYAEDPANALALGAFLAIAIATMLMYGLLIHLGLSIPGALFGALAFGISGTLTVNLHFYQRINALIWLPGILWAISSISKREGRARILAVLGLAVCMFMTHTAGFPPFALAVTLIAIVFCIRVLVMQLRRGIGATTNLAFALAGGAALGVIMASVQSVAAFEFFPESNRTMQAAGNRLASGGYDPAGFLGYLFPTLFTHPHINNQNGLSDQFSPLFWFLFSRQSWDAVGNIPAGTVFNPNLNFCEYTVFVGTPTLLLALLGAVSRGLVVRWFTILTLVTLVVLATAESWIGPVLEAAPFRWIPPTRFTGPTCLLIAVLAGFGVHSIPNLRNGLRRCLWITALVAGLACLGVAAYVKFGIQNGSQLLETLTPGLQEKYGPRFPEVDAKDFPGLIQARMGGVADMAYQKILVNFLKGGICLILTGALFFVLPIMKRYRSGVTLVQVLFVVMTAAELLRFGVPLNTGRVLHNRPLNQTSIHEFLRKERDAHASTGGFSVVRSHRKIPNSESVPIPAQLPPDTLLNEHIRDQQAYTFVDGRSHLPILSLYGSNQLARDTWALSIVDDPRLTRRYWDMIGVRFVLSEDRLEHAGKLVASLEGPKEGTAVDRYFYVYERPNPLPRAWFVFDAREPTANPKRETTAVTANDPALQDMVDAIISADFQPDKYVLIDHDTRNDLGPNAPRGNEAKSTPRTVNFPIPDETNSLTIEVGPGDAGYLVMNDTFMQGWTATIDGAPTRIHRGNLFQRVVVLPENKTPDKTLVEFRYTTPGFTLGAALSTFGGLVWLGLLGVAVFSRRRPPSVEDSV